jgi:tyrosyl-tRNA synthetase
MTLDEQIKYLTKGCVDVVRAADLRTKLERASQQSRPLVVKVGFDPTSPDLHLGHTVLIRKMKHFQDCGHSVIFVVGDFTALIGDPTGRSKTRPPLTREQIAENAETYKNQVFKLLDPEKTIVDFNSRWLGALSSEEWIRLTARYNVAQMLERRDFRKRYDKGQPIAIHEFLYPLAQAYDSIFLKADVELGGTDQLFNLNVGRDIMPSFNLEAQIVMTVPLLVGLDGAEKMNKSTGNYVGITEPPVEMFGKVMSISDELMWTYYKFLTDDSLEAIGSVKARVDDAVLHPKDAKVDLAKRIVTDFHSAAEAKGAATEFERVHSRGEQPSDMPEFSFNLDSDWKPLNRMMVDLSLASSASDGTRKISSGAVLIDGEKILDRHWKPVHGDYVLQVGRHFVRLVVK